MYDFDDIKKHGAKIKISFSVFIVDLVAQDSY